MSKYEPLAQFLHKRSGRIWEAEFSDVERILGFPLPKSAKTCPYGGRTRRKRAIARRRDGATPVTRDSRADFATRGAIAFLNGLGGTMPDFSPAPRDRPKA